MRPIILPVAVALLAVGASAPVASRDRTVPSDSARLDTELAGFTPGKPVSCIDTFRAGSTRGFGQTLVYRVDSRLKYRNDTGGGCEGVGRGNDILITRTPSTRLCRGDIAQTVDSVSGFFTGSCAFGSFVPYRK